MVGQSWFVHRFNHHDWRLGVAELKSQADEIYGHQHDYSGEINSCHNFQLHRPPKSFINTDNLNKYINSRQGKLNRRSAEIIELGLTGYSIAQAVVKEYNGRLNYLPDLLRGYKEPAILINSYGMCVHRGTVSQLKEVGKKQVLKEKFKHDYYIVSKGSNKTFVVTGEGKLVKNTSRRSNETTLILPMYNYIVYGWAGCR